MIHGARLLSPTTSSTLVLFEAPQEVFDGRIISRILCPPRFPDLKLCESYLLGSLKGNLYKPNPHCGRTKKQDLP
jgi:hypothetical protein